MLELKVHDGETEVLLRFEHSLRSLSKWESKNKPTLFFKAHKKKNGVEVI